MRISISYDVEDYISPPEVGNDDLLKMLADTMTEHGLQGCFFLIGEKLRCMRDRGRDDVIAALAKHQVGSHVNMGSIHPTVTERMSTADWSDGMARIAADDVAALEEFSEILGVEAFGFRRHGGSYAPQFIAALGRAGHSFANSPSELPNHHITWYCNAINFRPAFISYQNHYFDKDVFIAREAEFKEILAEYKDADWIEVFHSHPYMIKMNKSLCRNYYGGIFTPPEKWLQAEVKPEYDDAALRENFAWHCQKLRDDPDVEVCTMSDLARQFGNQAETADAREIAALAAQAAEATEPFFTDRFTAAEIVDLLSRAYLHRRKHGKLPDSLPRRDALGPTQTPLSTPTARHLVPEALARAARGIEHAVRLTGHVPSRLHCCEGTLGSMGEVGLGTAMVALGEAVASNDADHTAQTRPVNPYPAEGDAIADRAEVYRSWNPHRRDLDMADLLRHSRLQSWTLKPAWPDAPPRFA